MSARQRRPDVEQIDERLRPGHRAGLLEQPQPVDRRVDVDELRDPVDEIRVRQPVRQLQTREPDRQKSDQLFPQVAKRRAVGVGQLLRQPFDLRQPVRPTDLLVARTRTCVRPPDSPARPSVLSLDLCFHGARAGARIG